jgi:predicted DNA-binding protein with PD1-like motif
MTTVILFLACLSAFAKGDKPMPAQPNLHVHVLRLAPGDDPKLKLEAFVKDNGLRAIVVVSAVGSLTTATIRYANQDKPVTLSGHFEVVSLSGTLSATSGSHLHISVSDKEGKTLGGHLMEGSKVYTTLELALGEVTDIEFTRETDPASGYKELKVISLKK